MDELEKNIIKRIIEVRIKFAGERGRSKFAKLLCISPSTYSYYENDRVPPVPVLVKISQIANVDLNWLLTGESSQMSVAVLSPDNKILEKAQKIIGRQPQAVEAISAFLNLLEEKSIFESNVSAGMDTKVSDGRIPVLGRTAAGVPADWGQAIGTDSKIVETQIEQLVKKHLNASIVSSVSADVAVDSQTRAVIQALNKSQANLVQTVDGDDEVVQFVNCPPIHRLFPDSFALQVDGDSMSPRINDGDVVIVSPSVAAAEGLPAVVRLSGAIGVTCKLVRNDNRGVHLIPINERYETKVADKNSVLWALAVICHIKLKK
ncbi:MAG: helix-turn-helix domain-containing protein [Planctomycetaceae bacterium]|nr:helix-turn-helix domain-containing protein [Planctomycetaceae bacterium]